MKIFIHNLIERFKSKLEGRTEPQYEIVWNLDKIRVQWLTVENETKSLSFSWESILAIDTFKRDQITTDCICLAFETSEGWVEINEDMKNWDAFLKAVELRIFGFPSYEQWYNKVMLPAFETSHATLWNKKNQEQNQSHQSNPEQPCDFSKD